MRLYGFQEKNSLRYIHRSALGKCAYITDTNGEGLMQQLRHQPHWLQHGIEKASKVNAARAESRRLAGVKRGSVAGGSGWKHGHHQHTNAPTGCLQPLVEMIYSIIGYEEYIIVCGV